MTRLVLFDLDDTLVDRSAAYRRWAAAFAAGRDLNPADLAVLHDVDLWQVGLFTQLSRIHQHFAPGEDADRFWESFRDHYPRYNRCEPQVLRGLARLRNAGWTIGIVTNGRTVNQTDKITFTGLAHAVDGWAISEEVGASKPDPAIFHTAARRTGTDVTAGGWMVGDDLVADIGGGQAAGLNTMWLHHTRPLAADAPQPTRTAGSVAEAIDSIVANASVS
jgi:HAD superfamily hydrolase (TIGR01509 family)